MEMNAEERMSISLYRSLERLHLAVVACAAIGFEESSPTKNEHHASIWIDLNEAQKDAVLKLKHFVTDAPSPAREETLMPDEELRLVFENGPARMFELKLQRDELGCYMSKQTSMCWTFFRWPRADAGARSVVVAPRPEKSDLITVRDETVKKFTRLAGELHDQVHEAAALVNMGGVEIGWAPEDAIPLLAVGLAEAYEAGQRSIPLPPLAGVAALPSTPTRKEST
jgi:hypothetical protein